MALKNLCDRCGGECEERHLVEITKGDNLSAFGETGVTRIRIDLCKTCKTGLELYLNRRITWPKN